MGQLVTGSGNGKPGGMLRAALRSGACLTFGAGLVSVPGNTLPAEQRGAQQVLVLDLLQPVRDQAPVAVVMQKPSVEPPVGPAPVATDVAMVPIEPPLVAAAAEVAFLVPAPGTPSAPVAAIDPVPALRAVDIEQVTAEAETLYVPQLQERGQVAGLGGTLVAKIDAMQVPALPRAIEDERAALLAEAPSQMTVRIGDDAVGAVAFRMSDTGMIDVQLSGLLDLVADRMAPAEYSRLRGSTAADSYVTLDQLRAIGLSLRYDAVYDELDLSA